MSRTLQRLALLLCLSSTTALGICGWEWTWLRPKSWITYIAERIGLPRAQPAPTTHAAGAKADARFLVQSKYGYQFDPAFVDPMSRAIDKAQADMRTKLASGNAVTEAEVYAWMDGIAAARAEVAKAKGDSDQIGAPLYRSLDQMGYAPNGKLYDRQVEDYLSPEPDSPSYRHAPFFNQAVAAARKQEALRMSKKEYTVLKAFGETFEGCAVLELNKVAIVFHPQESKAIAIRNRAVQEIAKAMSDPSLSETEFIDRFAQSYALLMTATPYHRGSPSIVESFFDSALRAKYGKTLGRKTGEPFWDVVLRNPAGPRFSGDDLMRSFGGGPPETAN